MYAGGVGEKKNKKREVMSLYYKLKKLKKSTKKKARKTLVQEDSS